MYCRSIYSYYSCINYIYIELIVVVCTNIHLHGQYIYNFKRLRSHHVYLLFEFVPCLSPLFSHCLRFSSFYAMHKPTKQQGSATRPFRLNMTIQIAICSFIMGLSKNVTSAKLNQFKR